MPGYSIVITASGQKQSKKLSSLLRDRILPKLFSLESDPRPFGSHKLLGSDYYRIRVGDYRIIYAVDDSKKTVKILDIAHRREVYR